MWASRARFVRRRGGRRVRTGSPKKPSIGSVGASLSERCRLADPVAEEVELRATCDSVTDHLDLLDARGDLVTGRLPATYQVRAVCHTRTRPRSAAATPGSIAAALRRQQGRRPHV